ncbi:MAG: glycosyltransferase family 1 protein [Rhodospirillales bacterium]|nr:glycosyltransferase family 1 protein [Rhodospirillales bacterium]
MRILIVSDAWLPQVNGVVRSLDTVRRGLIERGHAVEMVTPDRFRTIPCPTYPEIRLAVLPGAKTAQLIEDFQPEAIHIATEGPLGQAARKHCLSRGYPYTTAYHTRFPEYIHARCKFPLSWSYAHLRKFHNTGKRIMVATQTIEDDLKMRGFNNIVRWTRGVNTELFHPRKEDFLDFPRPISVYVGRVAIEKNIEAFLKLNIPGTKMIVGDGPARAHLEDKYPAAKFVGAREGEDLARHFAASDVFVFPSRTDTFGLVLLEALASGLPVAAYPVPGPLDVIGDAPVGVLSEDLESAVKKALTIDPLLCRKHAEGFSWDKSIDQFFSNLYPFRGSEAVKPAA